MCETAAENSQSYAYETHFNFSQNGHMPGQGQDVEVKSENLSKSIYLWLIYQRSRTTKNIHPTVENTHPNVRGRYCVWVSAPY